jgi:hypothetical protein
MWQEVKKMRTAYLFKRNDEKNEVEIYFILDSKEKQENIRDEYANDLLADIVKDPENYYQDDVFEFDEDRKKKQKLGRKRK